MKNKIHILTSVLLASAIVSCEKGYDLIPAEYDTILLLQESGEKNLTLYTTGEDGEYTLTVMKSGNSPKANAEATLRVMSSIELEAYSAVIGRSYTVLPADTYIFDEKTVGFTSDEQYKKEGVTLKTDAIQTLYDNNTQNLTYVLPIELVRNNAKDSVNAEKSLVLIRPDVVTPIVAYAENETRLNVGGTGATYEFSLTLPFASPWDFECTIESDAASLPSGYTLIPDAQFTLGNGGKVTFAKGSTTSSPITVTLANDGSLVGALYALPLKVTSSTVAGMGFPTDAFILYGAYNRIPLTVEMLSSNSVQTGDGQGLAGIIDGNPVTYLHTAYTYAVAEAHYFQIALNTPITNFAFAYQNRNNANGKPQDITIWVSADGNSWETFNFNSGLPTAASSRWSSPALTATTPFKYFIFEVNRTNSGTAPTFFSLAEFELYGK
ncbi:MAG: DUF1735 domain-containing protein [Capnocytophaga sp.]|nr:DUF1735 domain-containing protein [Capnocytophaga sp.]